MENSPKETGRRPPTSPANSLIVGLRSDFISRCRSSGTLAGNVSPVLLFGVNGALASGMIAALAVTDRDAAAREFRRLAPLYFPQFMLRKVREYAPHELLKLVVLGIMSTYDPDHFPYLKEFVLWPPGLKS